MRDNPNLLFIFTDEQAANTIGAYGNQLIKTPNMDGLASGSLIFERAYATQPVCTPSRSSILTGLYPHKNGCTDNNMRLGSDIPCLPELGDFAEYSTGYFGKWHLGDEVFSQHGFQEWRSEDDAYRKHYSSGRDRNRHSTYHHYLIDQGFVPDVAASDGFRWFSRAFCARLPEKHSKPAYLAQEARQFIVANRDQPFILYVGFMEPHMPFSGPRDDQYDPQLIPLPPSFQHPLSRDLPFKYHLFKRGYREQGESGLPLKTEDDWRRMIANYWGLVSLVDTHLGTILDTLEDCGLRDDTIVVYTSDHGDMMGSHGLVGKNVMYEEAIRVPLMLGIPGVGRPGQRIEEPVSQIDLVPTLLDALGAAPRSEIQGYSWLPFLQGSHNLVETSVFAEWNGYSTGVGADVLGGMEILDCWREMASEDRIKEAAGDPVRTIIRPDGWKYTYSTIGEDQLYKLGADPHELANLARDGRYAGLVKDLRAEIVLWKERTDDTL